MSRVDKTGACWIFTGARTDRGYGVIPVARTSVRAHRVTYEHFVGPIPAGLVLDHLCRNTSCVNPDHLEAVTQRENVLRGNAPTAANARKTHCIRGHEFTPENTYAKKGGGRACRRCVIDAACARQRRFPSRGITAECPDCGKTLSKHNMPRHRKTHKTEVDQ